MQDIVIGLGETGEPLFKLLKHAYPETIGYDLGKVKPIKWKSRIMNICIPYSPKFMGIVEAYQHCCKPDLTIIHSTVPIGTTVKFADAVHSPILGKHGNMESSLINFVKWIGGDKAQEAANYLKEARLRCKTVETSQETEMLKLVCLAKYGKDIAFAGYVNDLCKKYEVSYNDVLEWDINYNSYVQPTMRRPIITPPNIRIGGHCVIPNVEILNSQHCNPMLDEILKYDGKEKQYKAWGQCNIYKSAKIGNGVNIGTFTEIGPNVVIGSNVRIGKGCFIPEGVTIEDNAWIGPHCCFTNDRYPPSGKENWLPTIIRKGARLGAAVTVICGVEIGENALIGAGAVVTKNIPSGEKWSGVPARRMTNGDTE